MIQRFSDQTTPGCSKHAIGLCTGSNIYPRQNVTILLSQPWHHKNLMLKTRWVTKGCTASPAIRVLTDTSNISNNTTLRRP
jgi:hypothetical protein